MVIDLSTDKGARVAARLRDELVAWLVTVARDGTPVPTPVWFWWDGETLLVYSQPDKPKLRRSLRTRGSPLPCGPMSWATTSP